MKNIAHIIRLSKPLHTLAVVIGILILASVGLQLIAPLFSKVIIDQIVANVQHKNGNLNFLILIIILSLVSNLLGLIVSTISDRLGDHFAGRLQQFLTEKFYDKVLTLPQSYFDSELSGKMVNQLSRGIITIRGFLNSATNFILPTFIQSIVIVGILCYFSLAIGLFLLILFPIYLTLSYYSTKKWGEREVVKNGIEDRMRGRIQEVISNMGLVKSFTREKEEYALVAKSLTESNKIYAKQSQAYHLFDFFRGLSLNLILFVISLIAFYNTFTGKFSLGELVLLLQLINQARIPLFAMSFILTQIQMAESGSKEYLEILALQSTENYHRKVDDVHIKQPTITFEHVNFNYQDSSRVLHDISFDITSGESVALVGHSGAGKSTIVNLILKFYEPTSGEIHLKGKTYKDLDASFVRNNISLVFQENELFSSTIRENVAYGKKDASEEELMRALTMANAMDFVNKLPKGLDSEVGERGVKLSGGQKQRIQIARAILKDAPILILDEATSSLDAKSEREVQEALENLMKGRLTIIIAHRFSTIQNVDKILVIDTGAIVDYGRPHELANRKGIYSELLHYQVEGNKKLLESFGLY